ncbi:MAG: DUF3127 domain-containing protein [Bacteroidota bacterium]|jgi:hypothetical protein
MEMSGTVIAILSKQTGTNKAGNTWEKQDFVIQTSGQYPKKLCFAVWGDKIAKFQIKEGEEITVFFDVESREYMGKYYTDVKAWNVTKGASMSNSSMGGGYNASNSDAMGGGGMATANPFEGSGAPAVSADLGNSDIDDLPF